jgi:hypothetical protein
MLLPLGRHGRDDPWVITVDGCGFFGILLSASWPVIVLMVVIRYSSRAEFSQ